MAWISPRRVSGAGSSCKSEEPAAGRRLLCCQRSGTLGIRSPSGSVGHGSAGRHRHEKDPFPHVCQAAKVGVKDAVRIVFALIEDLYGQSAAGSSVLQEVELSSDRDEWIVTVSVWLPSDLSADHGQAGRLKEFRLDALSGDVISMRFPSKRADAGAVALAP